MPPPRLGDQDDGPEPIAVHDVRGPLAVVLGQAELLLEEVCGPLTDKQRYALLKIQSNGDKMNERMTSESARLREVLGLED